MEAAEKHLSPGGWLIVAMPNPESFQLRVFGQFWAHFDAPRHLQLIPFQTLYNKLVLECGMQTIAFTTRDQGSLEYNQLGWTWSMRNCFRIRGASRAGKLLSTLCSWYEQVGKQGSCYTAIFKKPDEAV
jgi:hypothetical protein